jgi:hypothetical protein
MILLAAEQAILERLGPLADLNVFVENSPSSLRSTPQARLFVYWEGSTLEAPIQKTYNRREQIETLRYRLILEWIDLRDHRGVYEIVDKITELLAWFIPHPDTDKPLHAVSADFTRLENGQWVYSCVYSFTRRLKEA